MQTALLGKTDYMIPELDPNFLNGGLGVSDDVLKDIGENLADGGRAKDLANALLPFSAGDRQTIIASFLAFGGYPDVAGAAQRIIEANEFMQRGGLPVSRKVRIAWAVLGTASMAVSAYHGYRRNQSIGWAIVWGLLGGTFPVITPAVALAQGFGQRK